MSPSIEETMDILRERATREMAGDFSESVCVDDRLVAGQNPSSAQKLGEKLRDALNQSEPFPA